MKKYEKHTNFYGNFLFSSDGIIFLKYAAEVYFDDYQQNQTDNLKESFAFFTNQPAITNL